MENKIKLMFLVFVMLLLIILSCKKIIPFMGPCDNCVTFYSDRVINPGNIICRLDLPLEPYNHPTPHSPNYGEMAFQSEYSSLCNIAGQAVALELKGAKAGTRIFLYDEYDDNDLCERLAATIRVIRDIRSKIIPSFDTPFMDADIELTTNFSSLDGSIACVEIRF